MLAANAQVQLPAGIPETGQGGSICRWEEPPPAVGPPIACCEHDGGAPPQEHWLMPGSSSLTDTLCQGPSWSSPECRPGNSRWPAGGRSCWSWSRRAACCPQRWRCWACLGAAWCRCWRPCLQGQGCEAVCAVLSNVMHRTPLCTACSRCCATGQKTAAKCCRAHPLPAAAGPTDADTASWQASHTALPVCWAALPLDQMLTTARLACLTDLPPGQAAACPLQHDWLHKVMRHPNACSMCTHCSAGK